MRPATAHLHERQEQRRISDEDLEAAKQHGERVDYDDCIHCRYKGVCYVTVDGGSGAASRRGEWSRLTVSAPPSRPSIRTTWTAGPTSRGVTAAPTLSVQMTKVVFSGCAYNKPCDGWRGGCIDSPQCRQHRTPTDPRAAHLETIDFSKPGYGELLRELRGCLVLCAAGSLLVPVRCSHCHGIKRLKRGRDGVDESDAVRWITATAFRTAASGRSSNGPSRGARGRATATANRARATRHL